jgi:hypothetical protein
LLILNGIRCRFSTWRRFPSGNPLAPRCAIIVLDREAERLGYTRFWVVERRDALTSAD